MLSGACAPSKPVERLPSVVEVPPPAKDIEPSEDFVPEPVCQPTRVPWTGKKLAEVPISEGDPLAGRFTLAQALDGLGGRGGLVASIDTSMGIIDCELWPHLAPLTVANFVGLARGLRPWKRGEDWVKEPAYEGSSFHRVVPGFMIQGGDPAGTGKGDAGYVIPDEVWEGAEHDRPGLLCMANRAPNTGSVQFFILDGPAKHLSDSFTIFGECVPQKLVTAIASAEMIAGKPTSPVTMSVRIARDADVPTPPGLCD